MIDEINSDCAGDEIPFPPGFGVLLDLPFNLDIEQAKTYGATLFANRDFMAKAEKAGLSLSEREGKNETDIA